MQAATSTEVQFSHPSPLAEFWQSFRGNRGALIALLYFSGLVLVAVFASVLAPHSPIEQYRDAFLTPPVWLEGGSWKFILGTDEVGRDILSRLMHGSQLSLTIGLVSVLLSLIPGVILGLIAAFYPGKIGDAIMRLMDVMLALPSLLLAVAIVAILGPGLTNTMLAIAIVSLPSYVRLARASAMTELHKDYVIASRLAGASQLRLMFNTV
ncbi:MAG: ABC transporter permease subunit, partial [Deefgea sp.]